MIDSGVTRNYMSPDFKMHLGLLGIEKAQPEPISGLNGENLGSHLLEESGLVHMAVLGHQEQTNFNITPLGQYDVVLGIPWLRNHNPNINWKTGQIFFMNCKCPWTTGSGRESDILLWLASAEESGTYIKWLRDRLNRYQAWEPEDTTTHIVLAAIKTSEWHWLMNLLGWAPETNEQYYEYMMIKDDTKMWQDYYSWEHSDSSTEAESDSWI